MTIKIALIDSGVNPTHPHAQGVEEGCGFVLDPEGRVVTDPDFGDTIGHGTAIAGIILEKTVHVRLYALKIFYERLYAPVSFLLASLEWAIMKNMRIIHLSLGTELNEYRAELEDLCCIARKRNIVIVAAARSPNDRIFPSVFSTVIGVYWHRECDPHRLIHHPGHAIEFGAHGYPRSLPGIPREMNFSGSSFAAAHVTARAAQLLEKHPGYTVPDLKNTLADMSHPAGCEPRDVG